MRRLLQVKLDKITQRPIVTSYKSYKMGLDSDNNRDQPDEGKILKMLSKPEIMRRFLAAAEAERIVQRHNNGLVLASFGKLLRVPDLTVTHLYNAQKNTVRLEAPRATDYSAAANLIEKLSPEERSKWYNLMIFLQHDIVHVSEFAIQQHGLIAGNLMANRDGIVGNKERHPFDPEFQALYQQALQELPEILSQLEFPHQFFKALAEIELGKSPSEVEGIDLKRILFTIGRLLQLRFVFDDYILVSPDDRHKYHNEIVLDLSPSSLETNLGMIWSVLYNLMKNAAKELSCRNRKGESSQDTDLGLRILQGKLPSQPKQLYVKTEVLEEQGVTLIHVIDSGKGLDIGEIMNSIKEIIAKGLDKDAGLRKSAYRILEEWQKNPFAVRAFRMGDVYDLAGVARASGFVTRERLNEQLSSGLGLWGVNYLTTMVGGQIIYTNTAQGGAMFTLILPNQYFSKERTERTEIRSITRGTRRAIERGEIQVPLPLAA